MRFRYLSFLLLVVAPCAAAAALAVRVADTSWRALRFESDARMARGVLASLEQDLGRTVDSLVLAAKPLASPDTGVPAVQRALRGDTVTAIVPARGGFDVSVMFGLPENPGVLPGAGDSYRIRYASGPLHESAVRTVEDATGYDAALFVNGKRWASGPGRPDHLAPTLLDRLSYPPHGEALSIGPVTGAVVPMDPRPGTLPAVAALVAPRNPRPAPVSLEVRLIVGLMLLFSALAGWIQLASPRAGAEKPDRAHTPSAASVLLLGLVPALAALVLLSQVDASYRAAVRDTLVRDLARGMTLAQAQKALDSPTGIRMLTGFDATRVRNGRVASTTFPEAPLGELRALRPPPRAFPATGTVSTPHGPSLYLARRLDDGSAMIATVPWPGGELRKVRRTLVSTGGALVAWLAFVGLAVVVTRKRSAAPAAGPGTERPAELSSGR